MTRMSTSSFSVSVRKGKELEDAPLRLLWQSHNQSSSSVRRVRESRLVGTEEGIKSRSDELATRVIVEKEPFE